VSKKAGKEFSGMRKPFMKCVAWYLVLAMFVMGIVPRVYAGFSPSEAIDLSQSDRSADLVSIQKILEMKMVMQRLDQLGFSQNEIQSRLGELSDQQIHQLALQIDELRVAGDTSGIIIVVLVVVLAVVLFFWLTGREVVIRKQG
jgi:hypothetical protein